MRLPNHNGEVVHPDVMTCAVGMVINGEGAMRCSVSLSPRVSTDSPLYSSSHSNTSHLYLYITALFCVMLSLSLGPMGRLLIVLPPLKWTLTPILPQMLETCLNPWCRVPSYGCCCGCCCCCCCFGVTVLLVLLWF